MVVVLSLLQTRRGQWCAPSGQQSQTIGKTTVQRGVWHARLIAIRRRRRGDLRGRIGHHSLQSAEACRPLRLRLVVSVPSRDERAVVLELGEGWASVDWNEIRHRGVGAGSDSDVGGVGVTSTQVNGLGCSLHTKYTQV
jgi:hypothetical protein